MAPATPRRQANAALNGRQEGLVTTAMPENEEIVKAERALEEAHRALDAANENHRVRLAERQQLLDRASAAESETPELTARRAQLLQQLQTDDTALDELRRVDDRIATVRAVAKAFRESAALLDAGVEETRAPIASAAETVRRTQERIERLRHRQHAQRGAELLAEFERWFPEFVQSAQAFDLAHRAAFGAPPRDLPPPHTRVARMV